MRVFGVKMFNSIAVLNRLNINNLTKTTRNSAKVNEFFFVRKLSLFLYFCDADINNLPMNKYYTKVQM